MSGPAGPDSKLPPGGVPGAGSLRVLIVEDNPDDAELMTACLVADGLAVDCVRVDNQADFLAALSPPPAVILVDWTLPAFGGPQAIELCRKQGLTIPFIIVSGTIDQQTAVGAIRSGAFDYVFKSDLGHLPAALRRLIDHQRVTAQRDSALAALQGSEERHRHLSELVTDYGYAFRVEPDGTLRGEWVTDAFVRVFGFTVPEIDARGGWQSMVHPDDLPAMLQHVQKVASGHSDVVEVRFVTRAGEARWIRDRAVPVRDQATGRVTHIYGAAEDITERKEAEEALRINEQRCETFLNAADDFAFVKDEHLRYVVVNRAYATWLERSVPEILGRTDSELMPAEVAEGCRRSDLLALAKGGMVVKEEAARGRTYEVRKFPVSLPGGTLGVGAWIRDVTERREGERRLAEDALQLRKNGEQLRAVLWGTVQAMGTLTEVRDPYTAGHQQRVAELAAAIAARLGLSRQQREALRMAAEVHDIGKIGVPSDILNKPAALAPEEQALVERHPALGQKILSEIPSAGPVAEIVYQHHERQDGSGYPRQLKGDEILLEARILAVADVVEAMASHRPYRPARGVEAALEEVRRGAGTRYDAAVVAACEEAIRSGEVDLGASG
jgi:PAS domain S-box-containing protein